MDRDGPAERSAVTWAIEALPSYNVKLDETSVSGISSGAYMAVQFGIAHSSLVVGVGATSGGPFYCAFDEVPSLNGVIGNVIARCMQGDPKYPKRPITRQQMSRMIAITDEWARTDKIDPVVHLKRQKIWLFHGYNDGIVKAADVSERPLRLLFPLHRPEPDFL